MKARLYLLDDPMLQAMALGSSTIAVTRGTPEVAEDDELTGLLAHEAAHLHRGDSMLRLALIGMVGITTVQDLWFHIWMVIDAVLVVFACINGVLFTWVTPLIFVTPLILAAGVLVIDSAEAWLMIASVKLMARRLARA